MKNKIFTPSLTLLSLFVSQNIFAADLINPTNVPLATAGPAGAKPNIMFLMDTSGSMAWNYLGDEVANGTKMCKGTSGNFTVACNANGLKLNGDLSNNMTTGFEPPFMAYQFNKVSYNPNTKYPIPVDSVGNPFYTQSYWAAQIDPFISPATTYDLSVSLNDIYYCTTSSPTYNQYSDSSVCVRNGVNNGTTFNYQTNGYPNSTFKYAVKVPGSKIPYVPFYFKMDPVEYCDDSGINCSSTQTTNFTKPFYVRWCTTSALATQASTPTGAGTCQAKYDKTSNTKYIYPRYGNFTRVTLTSDQYQNYANWFSYYRTRMHSMKSATSLAFKTMDSSKRLGFITLLDGTSVSANNNFLAIGDLTQSQKDAFYKILFKQTPVSSTPLREALSRVGQYYAGLSVTSSPRLTSGMGSDPVTLSCQQNFTILSTDGYWNGNGGQNLSGTAFSSGSNSADSPDAGYTKRIDGVNDGGITTASGGTLADVAAYYYSTNLRAGNPKFTNNVPTSDTDKNNTQHMVTFTMALGIDGFMNFSKNYTSGGNKDLENIKLGAKGACSWIGAGVCNWPNPVNDTLSAVDDLWHAAIAGRGEYFSAQNTQDMIDGLNSAISSINQQVGTASAAAVSTPTMIVTDNYLFSSTYRTLKWDGELQGYTVDTTKIADGILPITQIWSAKSKLASKVGATSDSRRIYYIDHTGKSSSLVQFNYSNMSPTVQKYFNGKCSDGTLSQCANSNQPMLPSNITLADDGNNLVNYLRGQSQYYDKINTASPLFRTRDSVLGDIVDSSPVYQGALRYNWPDNNFQNYKIASSSKQKMVYVGANDGMIHAFNADTGDEVWSVIPNQQLPKMADLADTNYGQNHKFFVDGSISVMDVYVPSANGWNTYLVSGMGQGGRGYTILNVTDRANPQVVAEICDSATYCAYSDPDIGMSYGNSIITHNTSGQPVVYFASGYDNDTGNGVLYEFNLETKQLKKYGTPVVSSRTNQTGMAYINAFYDNFDLLNKTDVVYAGNLRGQIWKFDFKNNSTKMLGQTATSGTAPTEPKPISTKIEIGKTSGNTILLFGTGKLLSPTDAVTTIPQQSIYGLVDNNLSNGILDTNPAMVKQQMVYNSACYDTATGKSAPCWQVSSSPVDYSKNIGWRLDTIAQKGERVNVDPILAAGTLNVVTNVPATTECTAGGNYWYYYLNYANGGATSTSTNKSISKQGTGLAVGQVIVKIGDNFFNLISDSSGKVNSKSMAQNDKADSAAQKTITKTSWQEIFNSSNGN